VTISAERALDVNNDDLLSSADANQIINRLIVGHGPHAITVADLSDTYQYIDIDGNGQVTAFDAVQVVNHLIVNAQPAQSLTLSADSPWFDAVPLASVPEPSSWVLGTLAALVLAGYAVRRRRAARRA
jgi:MYXO-CTERM domain-containing protein